MSRNKHQKAIPTKTAGNRYKPGPDPVRPLTETPCPHCKATSQTGTNGGCRSCGKVKDTSHGKRRKTLASSTQETADASNI